MCFLCGIQVLSQKEHFPEFLLLEGEDEAVLSGFLFESFPLFLKEKQIEKSFGICFLCCRCVWKAPETHQEKEPDFLLPEGGNEEED